MEINKIKKLYKKAQKHAKAVSIWDYICSELYPNGYTAEQRTKVKIICFAWHYGANTRQIKKVIK